MKYHSILDTIGNTPCIRINRLFPANIEVWMKAERFNPGASIKDRIGLSMIEDAERRGLIDRDTVIIEPTSGNTGIALAMAAAIKGYKMKLIMPANMSEERRASMRAYGAEIITVTQEEGMEGARDLGEKMQAAGEGRLLDQFGNTDNPLAHYQTTGPEIWEQTNGRITHFVSSMGTTGTIMGVSRYLKERNPDVQIIGLQPQDDALLVGERHAPPAFTLTVEIRQ